jgi:lipid-binding SYLF domain-containing protein
MQLPGSQIQQKKKGKNDMKKILVSAALAISCSIPAAAQDTKLIHRIDSAHAVLHELMDTPDKGIPLGIAAKAHCVIVVPSFKKAAFGIGAEYGQGVATCRHGAVWSAPVFIQLTGASFGFQIGGESSDIVLIGLNSRSLDDLLKDKVKLGADAAVAAGPVGRDSQAATTELANAEFVTYSRSKGLFAGIDLNGDEVHQNSKDTEAFYGSNISFHQILNGGVPTPPAARHFVRTCNELFRRGRAQ